MLRDPISSSSSRTARRSRCAAARSGATARASPRAWSSPRRALAAALADQQARVTEALEAFADNTLRHLRDEGRLLADGIDFPPLATRFRDRHAVVVARGPGYKSDLRIVRPYIRNFKPVLVAVDGGADALLEIGLRPDVIVGDFDSATDAALALGGRAARPRLRGRPRARLGAAARPRAFRSHTVAAPGISEDIALLLAHERGAELIVAVGTHFNLVEFLERNREGMASTFVTRLKVGESLVDAKGVSRLVSPRIGVWPLVTFVAAGRRRDRRRRSRLARTAERDRVARPVDRKRARPVIRMRPSEALRALHSFRVRPPLPRRLADGRLRRARDRDPRRRRALGEGLRQRRRARQPDEPDRRAAAAGRRGPGVARSASRVEEALRRFADETYPAVVPGRLEGKRVAVLFVGPVDAGTAFAVRKAVSTREARSCARARSGVPLDTKRVAGDPQAAAVVPPAPGRRAARRPRRELSARAREGEATPLWDALDETIVLERKGLSAPPVDAVVVVRTAEPQRGADEGVPRRRLLGPCARGRAGRRGRLLRHRRERHSRVRPRRGSRRSTRSTRRPAACARARARRCCTGQLRRQGAGRDGILPPVTPSPTQG